MAGQIAGGDPHAVEELYRLVRHDVQQACCHLHSCDREDIVHEAWTVIVEGLRNGALRHPEALRSFIRTVVWRKSLSIGGNVWRRQRTVNVEQVSLPASTMDNPERRLLDRERQDLMARGLHELGARDCELLTRFYLYDQPFRQICREMEISETQFRLYKSRAKARLAAWTQGQSASRPSESAVGCTPGSCSTARAIR
ncbi:MAG: sigma-70 family RNA polymerase sigma factor [Acidobacteria bacterium]|nr:sigma-70 family RNA polymerase sigma factor [Acidobacteriota bacterium]